MANLYWVGGTANWDGTALLKWSATSGGIGGLAVPTSSDNVFLDSNSGNGTITIASTVALCLNLDCTGFIGTLSSSAVGLTISGSLTLSTGMTYSMSNTLTFNSSGTANITTNTQNLLGVMTFSGSGNYILQDNLTNSSTGTLILTSGTLDINGKTLSCWWFSSSNSNVRTLKINGGILDLKFDTANTILWDVSTSTNLTVDTTNGGTIKVSAATGNRRVFQGASLTYPNFWISNTSTGSLDITGSNTFSDFKGDGGGAHTIKFTVGTTTTVSTFNVNGIAGNLIILNSTTTGTHNLIKIGGGSISCDYLNIQHSVATPVNTWYAGLNSTNNQATSTAGSGWIFSIPQTGKSFLNFM